MCNCLSTSDKSATSSSTFCRGQTAFADTCWRIPRKRISFEGFKKFHHTTVSSWSTEASFSVSLLKGNIFYFFQKSWFFVIFFFMLLVHNLYKQYSDLITILYGTELQSIMSPPSIRLSKEGPCFYPVISFYIVLWIKNSMRTAACSKLWFSWHHFAPVLRKKLIVPCIQSQ